MTDVPRRVLVACIGGVVALVLVFVAYSGLRVLESRLLFPADQEPFGFAFSSMQARLRGYSAVTRPSKAQGTIRYLVCPPPGTPEGMIVVFHGNAGTAADRVHTMVPRIAQKNWATVLVEYPGYADDPTTPSEETLLPNALEAFDHATKNCAGPVVVFGRSLGSAVGTYVASKRQTKVKSLILVSLFPSIAHVVQSKLPLPVGVLKFLLQSSFDARAWAPDVFAPVTVIHGSDDRLVPLRLGREQAGNFPRRPRFVTIDDSGHNDMHHVNAPVFWRAIEKAMRDASYSPFEKAVDDALSEADL